MRAIVLNEQRLRLVATVLEVRTSGHDQVRLAMLGTLEPEDFDTFHHSLITVAAHARGIRIVLAGLDGADGNTFALVRFQVCQLRRLGVACVWSGPNAGIRQLLEGFAGEIDYTTYADNLDVSLVGSVG